MAWVRIDDAFCDHPKVDSLTDAAFRLHVAALCYSARLLTDGFIATLRPPRLMVNYKPKLAAELEAAGLWRQSPGGWLIHDFLAYNTPAEKVKSDREAAASRMRGSRSRAAEVPPHVLPHEGSLFEGSSAAPSHPIPSVNPETKTLATSDDVAERFEEFWLAYPKARRLAKPEALKAFKLVVRKASAETIIAGAKRYADDPNRDDEFTPYPQKWLKQERWNAPPELPRSGSSSARQSREAGTMGALAAMIGKDPNAAPPNPQELSA